MVFFYKDLYHRQFIYEFSNSKILTWNANMLPKREECYLEFNLRVFNGEFDPGSG